jgi:hypothetical protein
MKKDEIKKRGRKIIDKNETPNEKFIRIVNIRMNTVLYELRRLTNMVSQPNYVYTSEQLEKVLGVFDNSYRIFLEEWQKAKLGNKNINKVSKKDKIDIL